MRPSELAGDLSTAQTSSLKLLVRWCCARLSSLWMSRLRPCRKMKRRHCVCYRADESEGTCILYVSHRLDEVMEIADRVTVLRGGERIVTMDASSIGGTSELIGLMVGRPISELFPSRNEKIGEVALSVSGLCRRGVFDDINFNVRAGEVVGFAGLVGAGRKEIMRALFGADALDPGEIRKNGRVLTIRNPQDAIAQGIAYLPEDRKHQGLVLPMSGAENVVMASLERSSVTGFSLLQRSAG